MPLSMTFRLPDRGVQVDAKKMLRGQVGKIVCRNPKYKKFDGLHLYRTISSYTCLEAAITWMEDRLPPFLVELYDVGDDLKFTVTS